MDALQKAIRKIHSDPEHPTASVLCSLIKSLDDGHQFDINQLYQLNYGDFGLALELVRQWRLDSFRYERGLATKLATERGAKIDFPVWSNTTASSS
ncbi:MAG TPA: hypothetical protein VFU53_13405 [Burkholderiales bacterium]|jgi:hypothetical protein|nr:hypothetical protein [Burkholderiales bacterium]